jgi:transposase
VVPRRTSRRGNAIGMPASAKRRASMWRTSLGTVRHIHHGKLLWACNKWLRWAFIEGAWVAVGCSPYFGALYRRHRARGKKANIAITIVARRIATIAWQLLHEDRDYLKEPPTTRLQTT